MILLESNRFPNTFYQKSGKGTSVILLHGFGENSSIFNSQILALEQQYSVIVPDLPGSGKSDLNNEEMSMELLADFISEIMKQEGIDKTILLGHSMGGYAALAFAEKYTDQLLALGLIHSSAYEDDDVKKENRRKSIALIQNNENGKEVFLKAMIPNLYAEKSKQIFQVDIQNHLTMALEISSKALAKYYEAMINRKDHKMILKTINIPILFVMGTEDTVVPLDSFLQQCHLPQIANVAIFENVGHTSMIESAKELNYAILSFCNYALPL